jgi:hypothetical protein
VTIIVKSTSENSTRPRSAPSITGPFRGDTVVVTNSPSSDPTNLKYVEKGLAATIANLVLGRNIFGFDDSLATRDPDGGRITTITVNGVLAAACYSHRVTPTQAYLGGLIALPGFSGQGLATLAIHCNLADRVRVDGERLEVHAVVRLLPDGRINTTSAHILTHHFGFKPQGIVVVDLDQFGTRGTHLRATAEPDGHTIHTRLFVRPGKTGEAR